MKTQYTALPLFLIAALLIGCSETESVSEQPADSGADPACQPEGEWQFVCGPENAEDLVHLKGTSWVVASGEQLHLINVKEKSWQPLRVSYPDATETVATPFETCPAPLTDDRRYAHGITVRFQDGGVHELYVVNHDGRESVEVFDLDANGDVPSARWKGCIPLGDNFFGNSVYTLPDDGLVISISFDKTTPDLFPKMIAGDVMGFAYEWFPGTGLNVVPGSEVPANNGITATADGEYLYINSSSNGDITRIPRTAGNDDALPRASQELPVGLADNVHWSKHGTLLVAGHVGGIPASSACVQSTDVVCAMDSKIMELDPNSLEILRIIDRTGTASFGAVTSAATIGDEIWFGTLRGDRVAYMVPFMGSDMPATR